MISLVCKECGVGYQCKNYAAPKSKFCSRVCQNRNQAKRLRTENHQKVLSLRASLLLDPEDEFFRDLCGFNQLGRPYISLDGKRIQLSRAILTKSRVDISSLWVDHKNRNVLDNRKCNIRLASKSQNSCNKVMSKSKYQGITINLKCKNNPYRVQVAFEKIIYELPWVNDLQLAIAMRNYLVQKVQGSFGVFLLTDRKLSSDEVLFVEENLKSRGDHRYAKKQA